MGDEFEFGSISFDDVFAQLFSRIRRKGKSSEGVVPVPLPNQIALELACAVRAKRKVVYPTIRIATLTVALIAAELVVQWIKLLHGVTLSEEGFWCHPVAEIERHILTPPGLERIKGKEGIPSRVLSTQKMAILRSYLQAR